MPQFSFRYNGKESYQQCEIKAGLIILVKIYRNMQYKSKSATKAILDLAVKAAELDFPWVDYSLFSPELVIARIEESLLSPLKGGRPKRRKLNDHVKK